VTENTIEIETEIENGSDRVNPPGITTPSLSAILLRGLLKRLEELQRRPSGDGPIKCGIRGECTRHPNIRWNMPGLLRGNKKQRLLPRSLGGRS
jgi:hypothetical protein